MKKNVYVKPEITVMNVKTSLMTSSDPEFVDGYIDEEDYIGSGMSAQSKGNKIYLWGFDDEE